MAKLKIQKSTFMLIVIVWNLVAAYIMSAEKLSPAILALILGIVNGLIVWWGVENRDPSIS